MEHSPLGRLEPALRLEVYSLVLSHAGFLYKPHKDPKCTCKRKMLSANLGLLTTCKVIAGEATEKLYKCNDFALSFEDISSLAATSPRSTHIQFIHTRECALDLGDRDDRGLVHNAITVAGTHCPRLKLLTFNIAGSWKCAPTQHFHQFYQSGLQVAVGRWNGCTAEFPDLVVCFRHRQLETAWATIRALPAGAFLDDYGVEEETPYCLSAWFKLFVVRPVLAIEAYERREQHPDEELEGASELYGVVEGNAKLAVSFRPVGVDYVPIREIGVGSDPVLLRWAANVVWIALSNFETEKAEGTLLIH